MQFGELPIHTPQKVIIVGDVHGELFKLNNLLKKIKSRLADKDTHLVFTGDYCDRGPNTPGVLRELKKLKTAFPKQVFLIKGNHEQMVELTLAGRRDWLNFTHITMQQFLCSWNLSSDSIQSIAKEFKDREYDKLFNDMIPYYETDDLIVTHAPIERAQMYMYGLDLYDEIDPTDLGVSVLHLFERPGALYDLRWGACSENDTVPEIDKYLVCGHQCKKGQHEPRILDTRAFIDTGCGMYPDAPLTALIFPDMTVIQVK